MSWFWRKCFYAKDLPELREKEREYERDRLDKLDVYVMAKTDINYVFDITWTPTDGRLYDYDFD